MAESIRQSNSATPRERLADVCPRPAKATLQPQEGATRLREVAAEALRRATSQKAAAADIGVSEGRLSHKVKDGTLTLAQLEALGPEFGRELGDECRRVYGEADPKDRARRVLLSLRRELDELAEVI